MNFYRSLFSEKKRLAFVLFNIDCKFFCPETLNNFLESYPWSSIYCTTTAKLIDVTVKVVPPENCRNLNIKKSKIRKLKFINESTWFMKMMSFFHSIPLYSQFHSNVCNFRNCFIRYNFGEVEIHNKL